MNWLFDEESGSGWYDDIWWTNKPTVRYFYDGQMLVEEDSKRQDPVQGPITSVTRYGLGARGVEMIWWKPEGESQWLETNKRFPLYDGHGNMTALLTRNASGFTLSDSREFDAWGRVRFGARTGYPTHRYCASLGHVQDDESGYGTDNATDQGLVYMRARYYDPETGRFVSEDPARDGVNWFVNARSNPLRYTDSSGRTSEFQQFMRFLGAIMSGIGALTVATFASMARTPAELTQAIYMSAVLIAVSSVALTLGTMDLSSLRASSSALIGIALAAISFFSIPLMVINTAIGGKTHARVAVIGATSHALIVASYLMALFAMDFDTSIH